MKMFKPFNKILGLTAIGAVLLGTAVTGPKASAANPQFNFLPGDRDMAVGRTQNMNDYSDPVNANVSDRVTVALYYHNGVENSTAVNTRFQVQLPSGSSAQHVIKTTLSADNATAVTNTVVNGQIVGAPDMTINLNQAAEIHYVPGSTLWFPDFNTNPNQTGVHMPDDIVTPSGLNIGNIAGCWDHAGYVLFDVVFSQQAALQTDKWVAVFGGANQWQKEVTANPGDQLHYQIYYNNTGNGIARNGKIVDTLPAEVTYEPGSTLKRVKDANNNDVDIIIPDNQIQFSGQSMTIPLGDIAPGQNNSGFVYFRVKINNNLSVGTHVLVNNETLSADNTPGVSASAKATVVVNPTPVPDVKITKEVVNLTQGGTDWVRENTAKPGDTLRYRLTIYNQGNGPANNVSVNDVLPNNVSYIAGSTKIFTTDPNSGQPLPDTITTTGVNIGTVANGVPSGNRYITFDVKISSSMPAGNVDLINTSNVFMAGVLKDTSTAKTTVTAETGLLITKQVWNAATGQWVGKLDNVHPGDTVTYMIQVKNTGNTTITNPVIKDTLPNLVTYVAGSTRMDGSVAVDDQWITTGAGILMANSPAGGVKTITFQAKVQSCPPGGTFTLTNVASVTADGVGTKTASADIVVTAGAPAPPH